MAKGLGRGLESLFGSTEAEFDKASKKTSSVGGADSVREGAMQGGGVSALPIDKVVPNAEQPRKHFDADALDELAQSIKRHGVLQPILVSKKGSKYVIIAGERRWRASQLAGLVEIPSIIYEGDNEQEIALIENLQREDLNAVEAAMAIQRLMAECRLTQDAVATRIGKSRPYVTNLLRLLDLMPDVQNMVADGRLSMGHAKALLSLKDRMAQATLGLQAADGKMSVRELEKVVKHHDKNPNAKGTAPTAFSQSVELKELKNTMQRIFGTKVEIFGNDDKGRIFIDYYTRDDIDRIAELVESLRR